MSVGRGEFYRKEEEEEREKKERERESCERVPTVYSFVLDSGEGSRHHNGIRVVFIVPSLSPRPSTLNASKKTPGRPTNQPSFFSPSSPTLRLSFFSLALTLISCPLYPHRLFLLFHSSVLRG